MLQLITLTWFVYLKSFHFFYLCDDPELCLHGYSLLRADHPMYLKRDEVCIYYRKHRPLIFKSSLTSLNECLVCELKVGNKNTI